jgi:putative copper resistance protein D
VADFVVIALRGLAFAAALQAAGVPIFLALFGGGLERSARSVRVIGLLTALTGLGLTLLHMLAAPARLTGELGGMLDGSLQAMLLGSDFGTAAAIRLLGLGLLVGGWLGTAGFADAARLIGLTLVTASFAFMGHTAADPDRWLLAPLLIVHLLVVSFWLGSLGPLRAAARLEPISVTARIVERYSRTAVWLVPLILVAGVAMAGLLLEGFAALASSYGLLLLAKLAGFTVLMGLAAANKWRFGPGIAGGSPSALRAFRRTVEIEWLLIVAVIVATAVMTALFSPGH